MLALLSPRLRPASSLGFRGHRRIRATRRTTSEATTRLFGGASDGGGDNVITSSKSSTVKKFHALSTRRKKRAEAQQAVVEGPRMVFDLLENPTTRPLVRTVLVATDFSPALPSRDALLLGPKDGDGDGDRRRPHVQKILPELLDGICDTVTPQGIAAIVDVPDFSEGSCEVNRHPLHLVLDGVADPGNLGTLLRSSLAVGAASVVLLPGCCDAWNPKAVRSAMGASFLVPMRRAPSFADAVALLQEPCPDGGHAAVRRFFAATMLEGDDDDDGGAGGSVPYFDVDWLEEPTAVVVGGEGNGLSPDVRARIRGGEVSAAHVPMAPGLESLNAAVCGSVFLFEYQRQREMAARARPRR